MNDYEDVGKNWKRGEGGISCWSFLLARLSEVVQAALPICAYS